VFCPISAAMLSKISLFLAAAFVLLLVLAGVAALWAELGVTMTRHGWIAYGLGAGASFALAAGLFHLTFKSAKQGYDDRVGSDNLNE